MASEVAASRDHHRRRFGEAVTGLTREVSQQYETQLDRILTVGYGRKSSDTPESRWQKALFTYLVSMQWVGWGDCEFGPPLGLRDHSEIYALGMIAYLGARLVDDAIDGHIDYKGRFPSYYGYLVNELDVCDAEGTCAAAGTFLITASLRRMIKLGCSSVAAAIMQLYNRVASGVLCETLSGGIPIGPDLYRSVIRHKAVAYDRMLHVVFFRNAEPLIQSRILSFLSAKSESSQLLNDLCDESDDRSRNQMSILGVRNMDRETVVQTVLNDFVHLWKESEDLHPDIRNAMAVRLNDSLQKITRSPNLRPEWMT
jgi:hypothetical protein